MNFKHFFLVPVLLLNVHSILGQSLTCRYYLEGSAYTCELTLINPNGLNNFVNIDGVHMINKTDNDVIKLYQKAGSNSTIFPTIICTKFINLKELIMQSGKIRSIDEVSLKNCKNIYHANFFGNGMSQVHENAFIENTKLQTLYLYNNLLSTLPENVFRNQQMLTVLWLDSNRFIDFPLNIFKPLTNLIQLDLRANQLSILKHEWFAPLKKLQVLYLLINQIEVLPVNIFGTLENLVTLHMSSNRLKIINSNSFGVIQKLSNLFMDQNQISAIDEKIVDNSALTTVMMLNNLCSNFSASNVNKATIKQGLQMCFDNFESLMGTTTTMSPSSCNIADPTAELCDIKLKIGSFQGNLTNIVQSAFDLINFQRDRITKNENDIKDLKAIINQQQVSLQEKEASIAEIREELKHFQSTSDSNALYAEIQNMQANINFLLSRPCTC